MWGERSAQHDPGATQLVGGQSADVIPTIGPWLPLTLYTGHVASEYTPEYRIAVGRVELRGALIKAENQRYLTQGLPAIARPKYGFPVVISYGLSLFDVNDSATNAAPGFVTSGGVTLLAVGGGGFPAPPNSFVFLDSLSWAI